MKIDKQKIFHVRPGRWRIDMMQKEARALHTGQHTAMGGDPHILRTERLNISYTCAEPRRLD